MAVGNDAGLVKMAMHTNKQPTGKGNEYCCVCVCVFQHSK